MDKYDPNKDKPQNSIKISGLKFGSEKEPINERRYKEIEKKFKYLNELEEGIHKYNKFKELFKEIETIINKMKDEWKLFIQEEDGYFYDLKGNEIEMDIDEYLGDISVEELSKDFKRYSAYVILFNKIHRVYQALKIKYEPIESEENNMVEDENEYTIPDQKLRHRLLLFYELGIIDHLKQEIKDRDIKLEHHQRSYLACILGHLMNEPNPDKTLRKELDNLGRGNKRDPINKNSIKEIEKILADFDLKINKLK